MNAEHFIPNGTYRGYTPRGIIYHYGELTEEKRPFGIRYHIDGVRVYAQTVDKKVNGEWIAIKSKNPTYAEQAELRKN